MRVEYAFRWSEYDGVPETPLAEQQARERDEQGEEYTALVYEQGRPYPVVVNVVPENDVIDVHFLDDPGRLRVAYRFRRMNRMDGANRMDGREGMEGRGARDARERDILFLKSVRCYFYRTEEPLLPRVAAYYRENSFFDPQGLLTHEVVDEDKGETVRTKYQDIDLAPNWEPVPEFGDWVSITRYERAK